MNLVRLDPHNPDDIALLRQAYEWDTENVPLWYDNAEKVFGADSWDERLDRARRDTQIDVAVMDAGKFCGLITVFLVSRGSWEVLISGPRRSNTELITLGAFAFAKDMFAQGVAERFVSWVCSRHRGALRLNQACGMIEDGVTMLKGSSHGRPLEWKRLQLTKARMAELMSYGWEEEKANQHNAEHLRLSECA